VLHLGRLSRLMDHKTLSKDDKTRFPTSCTTEHKDECPNMDAKTSPLDEQKH
jgi:hypothetical protein